MKVTTIMPQASSASQASAAVQPTTPSAPPASCGLRLKTGVKAGLGFSGIFFGGIGYFR